MSRSLLLFSVSLFLLLPVAHAESDQTWDLRWTDYVPAGSNNLTTVERVPEGIHVQTSTDGVLFWSNALTGPADVLTLMVQTQKPVSISLLWHPSSSGQDEQAEYPLDIKGSGNMQQISIALTDNQYWDWKTNQIGIGIPGGTDMVMQSLTWRHYTMLEKFGEGWRSFWSFDGFHAYSINFLWGPLLASNPVGTENLYTHFPPSAWSITRVMYGLLAIALVIGILLSFLRPFKGKQVIALCFWGMFLCLWIVFDLRMSAEQMGYVVADWQTYVLPAEAEKVFRTNMNLPAIIKDFAPVIARYDRYILLTPPSFRSYSNMRYETYPSVALQPGGDTTGIKLWAVVKDPGVQVNADHQLVDTDGKILTGAGQIIEQYAPDSFLFAIP